MSQLFSVILSLSVSGGLVGLLILAVRPFAGKHFAKRWTYYLWLLVIARLLVPVHGNINLMEYLSVKLSAVGSSLSGTVGGAELAEEDGRAGAAWQESGGEQELREAENGAASGQNAFQADQNKTEINAVVSDEDVRQDSVYAGSEMPAATGETGQNGAAGEAVSVWTYLFPFFSVIWLIGVLFTALQKLWIYRRFVKEVCAVCAPVADQRILGQYAEIRNRLGVKKVAPLYESAVIDSPMLIGFCNPCIYLPSGLLGEMNGKANDIGLILHHELIHYKRKDIWYKWLFQAALCVHWFNPLVYVFQRKFNVDCELACDETMLKLLSEEGRRAYGNVLLDVAQKNWTDGAFAGKSPGTRRNVPAMTLLEEKSTLKDRLRGIAQYHRTGLAVGLCSAAVLVLLLALAVVCGAAGVRSGLGQTFSMRNHGNLAAHFREKSMWSEMWKDSFDLDQPMLVSTAGKAYRMYDDDALIAEDSESDCWRAWLYAGVEGSVHAQEFALNGSHTLLILYANKETTLEISSRFNLRDGRFKLVRVRPDQSVETIDESGEVNTVKLVLPQGRNVIKMVGQKAKLEELDIAYEGIKKGDFDGIYDNEISEYAYQVLDGKQKLDPARLEEVCPYLKAEEVSGLSRKAWEDGIVLSKENWKNLFVYSDTEITTQYLLEELQVGRVREFDSGMLIEIAPYMAGEGVSECFRYLLERGAVFASDWEDIFRYSDADKSAEYLAQALRKGKVNGISGETLESICYLVSVEELTDLVTAMDELSFESLKQVLAFVQDMDEAVTCVCYYIDLEGVLTDDQLRDIESFLSEKDFYRVVEYNGKKK